MSDDVNKSNKPVNGKAPKHLREAFESRDYNVSYENLSSKEDYTKLSDKLEALEQARTLAQNPNDLQSVVENIGYVESDMEALEASYAQRYNEQLASSITTYSKARNVNERTTTMSSQQRFFRQARSSEDKYVPTEVLERRIQSGIDEASSLGSEIAGRSRGLGTEDTIPDSLRQKASRMQQIQEEVALNKRLLKVQSREGLSTEKRQYSASDTLNRAGGILSQDKLSKEVASGTYGNLAEETDKLAEMFTKLQDSLERFEAASENATDAQGNLTEEYKQASKDLDTAQKQTEHQRRVVGEVGRQYGGGTTIGERVTENFGEFRRIVRAGYGIDIDDKMSEMRLKGAMGQRGIDQYNRVQSAVIGGDARSLLRETSGQEFVEQFSDLMRSRSTRRALADTTMMAPDAVGGIIDSFAGGMKGRGKGVGGIAKGLVKGVKGLSAGVVAGGFEMARGYSQVGRGIPQTMTALEASRTAEQYANVLNEVPAQGMQAVMDQAMLAGEMTVGAGSMAQATEQTLLDGYWMKNFASKAGLSPSKLAQLTQQSVRQIGGTESGTSVALRAGQIEQSRMMRADEFINMSGQLSNVGGGSGDLEEIMKSAVAAGMDNAKNIQQMAQATIQMSGELAKSGVAGTGAAGNLVAGSVQSLRAMGVNQNIATSTAMAAMDFQRKTSSDIGMDIGTVHEFSRIRSIAPGASLPQQMRMASLTQGQMEAIMKGGKEEADKFGLGSVFDSVGKDGFKRLAAADRGAQAYKLDAHILANESFRNDMKLMEEGRYDETSEDFKAVFSTNTGTLVQGQAVAGREAQKKGIPNNASGFREKRLQQAAEYQTEQFQYGAGDDVNKTLGAIATALQALSDNLKPQDAEQRVQEGARDMEEVGPIVEAGDTFQDAAGVFSKAVNEFNKKLKATDMGETQVEFNMREGNKQGTRRGGRQGRQY